MNETYNEALEALTEELKGWKHTEISPTRHEWQKKKFTLAARKKRTRGANWNILT